METMKDIRAHFASAKEGKFFPCAGYRTAIERNQGAFAAGAGV